VLSKLRSDDQRMNPLRFEECPTARLGALSPQDRSRKSPSLHHSQLLSEQEKPRRKPEPPTVRIRGISAPPTCGGWSAGASPFTRGDFVGDHAIPPARRRSHWRAGPRAASGLRPVRQRRLNAWRARSRPIHDSLSSFTRPWLHHRRAASVLTAYQPPLVVLPDVDGFETKRGLLPRPASSTPPSPSEMARAIDRLAVRIPHDSHCRPGIANG
jgi:hypothetical protein